MATTIATTTANHPRWSQNSAAMNAASSTAAVRSRVRNKRSGVGCRAHPRAHGFAAPGFIELFAGAPEAALARPVGRKRGLKRRGTEIRPERVGEMQLRI